MLDLPLAGSAQGEHALLGSFLVHAKDDAQLLSLHDLVAGLEQPAFLLELVCLCQQQLGLGFLALAKGLRTRRSVG